MFTKLQNRTSRSLNSRPTTLAVELLEGRWVPSASPWHDLEPNDTPSQAQDLSTLRQLDHAQVDGTIATASDVDWYRFDLLESSKVALQLSGAGSVALFQADPQDASRVAPVAADQVLSVGAYFVAVSGGVPGDYQLSIAVAPPPAVQGSPVDFGTLLPDDLLKGVSVHRDHVVGDVEHLQFTVTEQNVYLVTLTNAPGAPIARVALADSEGKALTPSFTMSDSNFRVLVLVLDPGTYRLKVSGWDAGAAEQVSYTLRFLARIRENPTPLASAPAPAFRLRLTTNAEPTSPASTSPASPNPASPRSEPGAPAGIAQTPRLVLPSTDGSESLRFVNAVRLSGTLGGDLPRPSGATTGLSAGPIGVASAANPFSTSSVRLNLPTEQFAGLDSRGGFAFDDTSRDSLGMPASVAWASETVGQLIRATAFQSIHWLNLPRLDSHEDTIAAMPAVEFNPEAPRCEEPLIEESPTLAIAMPASPRQVAALGTTMPSWLTLGVFAGVGGLLLYSQEPERRRGSPSLPEAWCEGR